MAESYTLLSKTWLSSICLTCSTIDNQTCCILKRAGPTTQNFANLRSVFLMPPAYFLSLHFFVFYCFLQVADINEVLNICVFKGTLYMPLNVFRATVEKVAEVALFSGGLHLFEATQARAVVKISTEKSRICFAFSHCWDCALFTQFTHSMVTTMCSSFNLKISNGLKKTSSMPGSLSHKKARINTKPKKYSM